MSQHDGTDQVWDNLSSTMNNESNRLTDVGKKLWNWEIHLSITIIPDSGKTHQWILRVVEKV